MDEQSRALVDAEWQARLRVDLSTLRSGGVRVVVADLGASDAMSFLFEETCIVVVPANAVESAEAKLAGLDARAAFSADVLRRLVGDDAQVDGPSWHGYVSEGSFRGTSDSAAFQVGGDDGRLLAFLEDSDLAGWAESGFPPDPASADPETTRFWVLQEDAFRVVAVGNMTEWRGLPADVGVLTSSCERRRGLASRLVGAMVTASLPVVGVARYRALASNTASLAVARRLGFEPYGQNYRARKATG